jgi:hypothetical protein
MLINFASTETEGSALFHRQADRGHDTLLPIGMQPGSEILLFDEDGEMPASTRSGRLPSRAVIFPDIGASRADPARFLRIRMAARRGFT